MNHKIDFLIIFFSFTDQNFYFANQGRFQPTAFQSQSKNNFFPSETLRQQNAPGSYQEQRLYLGNTGLGIDQQHQDQSTQQQNSNVDFFSFPAFPVSNLEQNCSCI